MSKQEFLWGAATSAHQVEGGNFNNNWWEFEQKGLINDGASSHPSCDHYHRFATDFDLLSDLGCNAYRFSIEWSRVEPSEGEFSQEEIDHYHRVLDALIERDITPLVTLHHFTNPLWFVEKGGWEGSSAVTLFTDYVEKMIEEYSDKLSGGPRRSRTTWWITFNEPNVFLLLGYLVKYWPPQKRSLVSLIKAFRNLVKAHQRSYQIIHDQDPQALVSIAHHTSVLDPWHNNYLDNLAKKIYDKLWNLLFLERIIDSVDFIGLNYYTRQRVQFPLKIFPTPGKEAGFAQWEVYPQGLLRVLRRLKSYSLPVVITEYGMPTLAKISQENYLEEGLNMVSRAMDEGIDVRGFFYWSLLDNFEWREGLTPRFGLYEVDYENQQRRLRRVGERYRELT